MVMQDSTSRWSSGVCERVEGGRAALQCVLLIGAAWEPTCRLQTTLLLTSLMHHAVWILTINRIVLCICLWILWPIYSVSYSIARGCSMLNQILMTFMYMQLFHVLHMHLLRLTPQCHEFFQLEACCGTSPLSLGDSRFSHKPPVSLLTYIAGGFKGHDCLSSSQTTQMSDLQTHSHTFGTNRSPFLSSTTARDLVKT